MIVNRLRIFILTAFLLASFSSILFAQSAKQLHLGASPASGYLNSGEEIWYTVRVDQNGIMDVETGGTTDTYIEVYDDRRNILVEDDDSGEDLNARVSLFVAAGKSYLIKLRAYSDESGSFSIWAVNTPIPASTELRFENVYPATNLAVGASHWYSVSARERGFVVVETFGNEIDSYLEAYNAQYQLLIEDDDGGEDTNARIKMIVEPNQTVHFRVRGYNTTQTGRYSIRASFDPFPVDSERNNEQARASALRLRQDTPVFFHQAEESRWYSFKITQPDTWFVAKTKGDLDTLLFIYDGQNNLIGEDDDSGDNFNAMVFRVLDVGTYFIEVRSFSEAGRSTIHIDSR